MFWCRTLFDYKCLEITTILVLCQVRWLTFPAHVSDPTHVAVYRICPVRLAITVLRMAAQNVQSCPTDWSKIRIDCTISLYSTMGELSRSLQSWALLAHAQRIFFALASIWALPMHTMPSGWGLEIGPLLVPAFVLPRSLRTTKRWPWSKIIVSDQFRPIGKEGLQTSFSACLRADFGLHGVVCLFFMTQPCSITGSATVPWSHLRPRITKSKMLAGRFNTVRQVVKYPIHNKSDHEILASKALSWRRILE